MNIDEEILNNFLTSGTQQYIKRTREVIPKKQDWFKYLKISMVHYITRPGKKGNLIISTDTGKAFDKL